MKDSIYVIIGGAFGALSRYKLSELIFTLAGSLTFPVATFTVNILGCLLAGIILGLSERYQFLSHEARLFIFTGMLGGFTTFSAFGVETLALLKKGEVILAAFYVGASVLVGVLTMWLGASVCSNIGRS